MELKPNMYVRTKKGNIYKFETNNSMAKNGAKKYMVNCSYNIIDLIEVGDYVNGEKVIRIDKDPFIKGQINLWTNTTTSNYWGDISLSPIIEKDIKSIVTHEQMEQMSYKVGD